MTVMAMNVSGWGTLRDDSLPHQIRHLVSHEMRGGLGVFVTCVCVQEVGELAKALGGRNIESDEDAWVLYNAHLVEGRSYGG